MIKITKYLILIVILAFGGFVTKAWSQNTNSKMNLISYTAIVKDSIGNPIKNAEVFGNQGDVKTLTNSDGLFTIKVNLNSDILIKAEGFNSSTVNVQSKTQDIMLRRSPFLLGSKDVISMGFKNTKKGLSVGNVTKIISSDILKNDNLTSFQEMLDTYGAGSKGGVNLLGIGNALVIVDGLPRDPSNLIPEEIENITILKDVNSALLYGSKAKNGVILIKTKRGTPNEKLIKLSIDKGIDQPIGIPSYLNSRDYMTLYNEACTNDGKPTVYDPAEIAKYDGSNPYNYPDVNYYGSEYLKSVYNTTRIVGEFGGGNNIATYYANASWENQDVLYKANNGVNDGTNRLKVRGNVDVKINEHLKSYIDAAFLFATSTGIRSNYFSMASMFHPNDYSPLLPISSFEDPTITGPLTHVNNNYILGGNSLISKNSYGMNVIGELNYAGYSTSYQNTMQFNTGIIYDLEQITQGLTFRANISFDNMGAFSEAIQNTYALYEPTWSPFTGKISSLTTINSDTKTGVLTLNSGSMGKVFGTNLVLDYDRTFNADHHISSSLLGYYSSGMIQGSNQYDKNAHLGLNVVYDYKKTYVIDFTGNMTNSVKLAPGNRLDFSPSLGIAWVLSNADFWKTNNIINYLKFKTTAGILQTDAAFGYNLYNEVYGGGGWFTTGPGLGSYVFGTQNVARSANTNLQMEKMKNLNIGFESALFKKSLYFNANYFITNYADQIVQRFNYYPSFYSTAIPYENYNETQYSGLDISLNYVKKWKDFGISS
ncbi:MAG: TonB-dependent receptor plug domain-containing protein, partial [Paludibacter sp.]